MKTIQIEEQNFTEKMFGVLRRNEVLNTAYFFSTKDVEIDKATFVEYAKNKFTNLYEEADSIVNDPNRKLTYAYADDIDHLISERERYSLEKDDLHNVIADFLEENNLRQQFSDFLKAAEQDSEKSDYYAFVLDELLDYFGKPEQRVV